MSVSVLVEQLTGLSVEADRLGGVAARRGQISHSAAFFKLADDLRCGAARYRARDDGDDGWEQLDRARLTLAAGNIRADRDALAEQRGR